MENIKEEKLKNIINRIYSVEKNNDKTRTLSESVMKEKIIKIIKEEVDK